jgi:heptaprenylglyceryl phosphate synthase
MGQPIGQHTLAAGGFCCSAAAAAVTASQAQGWVKAAAKVGNGGKIAGNGLVAFGKWAGYPVVCAAGYCKVGLQKAIAKVAGGSSRHTRDVSELAEIHERMSGLIARYLEADELLNEPAKSDGSSSEYTDSI